MEEDYYTNNVKYGETFYLREWITTKLRLLNSWGDLLAEMWTLHVLLTASNMNSIGNITMAVENSWPDFRNAAMKSRWTLMNNVKHIGERVLGIPTA